jgi:hypothetical protein
MIYHWGNLMIPLKLLFRISNLPLKKRIARLLLVGVACLKNIQSSICTETLDPLKYRMVPLLYLVLSLKELLRNVILVGTVDLKFI